jgi:hypothetical protein
VFNVDKTAVAVNGLNCTRNLVCKRGIHTVIQILFPEFALRVSITAHSGTDPRGAHSYLARAPLICKKTIEIDHEDLEFEKQL